MLNALAPKRFGTDFRWLLSSSWVSNLGDGFALAAGPLLVASQTHNPTLVAMATLLQRLPWLLFALFAGELADRRNRVTMAVRADLARAALLVLLAITIVTRAVDIAIVLFALFLLGAAEVFSNTAFGTLLPNLVDRDDLVIATARVQTGFVTVFQLVGPPVGAVLFAATKSAPFVGQALLVAAGAGLARQISLPTRANTRSVQRSRWHEIREGFRWLVANAPVRTLALTIFTFNVTFGAAWSVLVLYARERLHMGAVGFGLLTTATAIGGLLGTTSYGRITRHISLGRLMQIGLIIETLTHLGLALTTNGTVALGIMFVFGVHAFVWNTTAVTVRQRAVPNELRGRVASIYNIGVYAGLVIGAAIGGPIAGEWGITAPFWFGFVGSAVLVALFWRNLRLVAHND